MNETTHSIEFTISANAAQRFADLTGDYSSLHTAETFGRKSMYRQNIIHGMLPVSFISALNGYHTNNHRYFFKKISAKFIKPVFAGDKLKLTSKIIDMAMEQNIVESEYTIENTKSQATLTTGRFTIEYTNTASNKEGKEPLKKENPQNSMVINSLKEADLLLDQINKGDEEKFQFLISRNHLSMFYEILTESLSSDQQSDYLNWTDTRETSNLLTTCLFSTFVGICIPGKHATFIDFASSFSDPIEYYKKYTFKGQVKFKSQSTQTLVENISIHDAENQEKVTASGKINVKVNEPPAKMPSIEFLKNNALDLNLKNKIVLITGASRGIGETTAKLFSLHGGKIAINYFQSEEEANEIVKEITAGGGEAFAIRADVSDRQQVKQMVSKIRQNYGAIDVLINNAVRDAYPIPFMELSWADIQKDIDVTIKGAFNCCQEVIPLMLENKGGKIINISTIFTKKPPPNQSKYVISKSGLEGLTRSLAMELAANNIQVNMVIPSIVETDLSKGVPKIFMQGTKNDTPMKRNATSIDVAKAVIFLASSLAEFTTGEKIMVTGGNTP
jgi:3-oxoacyl-[acyl-carrier protein] reductase